MTITENPQVPADWSMATRRVPADWSIAALQLAGATVISQAYEEGELVGLEVSPPVNDQEYAKALAAAAKADLVAYAHQRRIEIETGGITVSGIPIKTDEESQRKILGSYVAATRDPEWSTLWGSAHAIDAEAMIAIGDAVQRRINDSFTARGAVLAGIEDGSITLRSEVDAAYSELIPDA